MKACVLGYILHCTLKNYLPPPTLFVLQFCDIKNSTKVSKSLAKLVKFTLEKKKFKKQIPPILLNKNSLVVPTPNHKSCVGREREKRVE